MMGNRIISFEEEIAIISNMYYAEMKIYNVRNRTKLGISQTDKKSGRRKGDGPSIEVRTIALETRRANSRTSKENIAAWNAIELAVLGMESNHTTWAELAEYLNRKGLKTRYNKEWRPNQVKRLATMMQDI